MAGNTTERDTTERARVPSRHCRADRADVGERRAEVERASAAVREWLLAALDPSPGQTLLELAGRR